MSSKRVLIDYMGSLYKLNRKVSMDGSYYFVNLNGELRCTQDLNKPFSVPKLPRGAQKVTDEDFNHQETTLGKLIKMQNELQDKIASLEDASRTIGRDIFKMFKELPEEEILVYYTMMNKENDSTVRFEIFREIVLPSQKK